MLPFAVATLVPVALIGAAALWGGPWGWAALVWMTALTATVDRLAARVAPGRAPQRAEFPAAGALSAALALGQLGILPLVVWSLATGAVAGAAAVALYLALGLFLGQIGNANAHELIHRRGRILHGLGVAAYVSVLYGHHASSHVLIHHVRVGTRADPATARLGEGLYRFMGRAWRGSFREGWRAERARLAAAGRPPWRHPYVAYLGGGAACIGIAAAVGGLAGVLVYLGLSLFAQAQLLMSDYVQHYGLMRALRPDGRAEPVGDRHSWNAPHPMSAAMLLNAPRHSDHHGHPLRPGPALRLPADAPMLPQSLPVMACVALLPPLWRRVMDPRARAWAQKSEP